MTADALAGLGASRLAALLAAAAEETPALARRLRIELLRGEPAALAREIDRRIATLRRARGSVAWRRMRALEETLEALRASIAGPLMEADPDMGLERLLDFLALAAPAAGRADDPHGRLKQIFSQACMDFADAVSALDPDLQYPWASRGHAAAEADGHGLLDALPGALIPRLAEPALGALRAFLHHRCIALPREAPVAGRLEDRPDFLLASLAAVADAQGDVDAFLAAEVRRSARLRDDAGIALRLIRAGRASQALDYLQGIDPTQVTRATQVEDARIEALDALGRMQDAQAGRWRAFEQRLSPAPLRAFLRRLPDFDADEKLEEAFAFAARQDLSAALAFLLEWPALREAGALVRARSAELDGDLYHIYTPAAQALEARDPLAATLLRRAMIDFTLEEARSSRYGHAARHLAECEAIAAQVTHWRGLPDHEAYLAGLRARRSQNPGFWGRVAKRGRR